MFEMIGLLFGVVIFFAIASLVGVVFALLVWGILPKPSRRLLFATGAFTIPLLAVFWMLLSVAMLPGESLFGDIDQPLPNGYHLTGLAKMPEYSTINNQGPSTESLDVNGSFIAAQVCEHCDPAFVEGGGSYLLIDTQNNSRVFFPTLEAMRPAFGRPVHLIENMDFRSQDPAYLRQKTFNKFIMFIPPMLLTIAYFAWLLRLRRESLRRQSNL